MSLISEFKINIIIMNIVPFMKRKKKYDFDFNLMIINKLFLFYSQHTTQTYIKKKKHLSKYNFMLFLDQKVKTSNIDSLLQELKILGYVESHLNIIQLIGCFTEELTTKGMSIFFI